MASELTAVGWTAPPEWLTQLEAARGQLARGVWLLLQEEEPSIDLAPVASPLESAIRALYDAFDRRGDRLDGVRRAARSIDEGCVHLGSEVAGNVGFARVSLDAARVQLEAAAQSLSKRGIDAPAAHDASTVASGDTPHLHRMDRPSLIPRVAFAAPPPAAELEPPEPLKPVTFQELEANIALLKMQAEERREAAAQRRRKTETQPPPPPPLPEGFAKDFLPAISEQAFVEARTRDMLEEVAMVGLQRVPLTGDAWRGSLGLEQRMCRAIDAIASMGPQALDYVERWALDGPIQDATRMFATAMTMGSFAGYDALGVIERVYQQISTTDETCRDGLVAALMLVPHEGLWAWLRGWLTDADAHRRAIAIETLALRGLAEELELVAASVDEPTVARRALVPLARAAPQAAREALEQAMQSSELVDVAHHALALMGDNTTRTKLTEAVRADGSAEAAMLLALVGDDRDAGMLVAQLEARPTLGLVKAVGWAGFVPGLPVLISVLESNDEDIQVAAARALDRITGAGLVEEAEVDAEDIFVAEPPDPDVGEPRSLRLVRVTSDPRDLPPEPSKETVERPSTNPDRWRAWFREHGAKWPQRLKHRLGKPYTPNISLLELDQMTRSPTERRWLIDELIVRTGVHVRMDPHDWVGAQEAAIERWREHAERSSSQPGSWARASRR